ncbi:uncharacterized protein LOC143911537 isoform X2 [Arctopsyche grandis]
MLAVCFYGTWAQYNDGPAPPRIQIPGAIALGPRPGNFRQGRVIQAPLNGPVRVRRPGQVRSGAFKSVPTPLPYIPQEEPQKPVTEEPEDIPESTPLPFLSSVSPFTPTQLPHDEISQFLSNPSPTPRPIAIPNAIPVIQQKQPEPIRIQTNRPLIQNSAPSAPARFDPPTRPQPVRLAPISYRPARPQFRPEARPQLEEDDEPEPIRQSYRPQPTRPQQQAQPPAKYQQSTNTREKKPVAQVIRKYREDNPDGSITWGFENDDGSFKEEIIGIDCVTRGRYGYVDPDGMKREYSYETGILCDKTKDEPEEKGFIDYQGNKAVLPNGVVVDLAAMGKKSKRPQQYGRN